MNAIQVSHIKEYIKRKKNVRDAIKYVKYGAPASDVFDFVEEYLELLNLLDDYLKN